MKSNLQRFFEAPEASNLPVEAQGEISESEENKKLPILELLKKTRNSKNLTLRKVADILCIHLPYLEAIERGDKSEMPERVYTLGFVKSYAKYLGLNVEEILERFKEEILGEPFHKDLTLPQPLQERSTPRAFIILLASLAFLGVLVGWYFLSSTPLDKPILSPPLQELKTSAQLPEKPVEKHAESSEAQSLGSLVSPEASETPPPSRVTTLKIQERSWVELRNREGQVVLSRIFEPGETYTLEKPEGYRLTTGNAGGVMLSKGEENYTLGRSGEVLKNFSLDPHLVKNPFQP